ncbi:hypothetical protein GCM10027168_08030 [Streptomyces capparidis]
MSLPVRPEDLPAAFAERFNRRDPRAVAELYEPDAVFVPAPGSPVTGEGITRANDEFLGLGLPITVRPRHIYTAGDLALLIVDWTITGTTADGHPTHIEATATDVAHRGTDGHWRYTIDNPFGTTHPETA